MEKRETHWYVEPLTDDTNEQLAAILDQEGLGGESETSITVSGKDLRVYQVTYRFITMLERSSFHQKHFRVYRKQGNGKLTSWAFQGPKHKVRNTAEYKRTKKKLKDISKK